MQSQSSHPTITGLCNSISKLKTPTDGTLWYPFPHALLLTINSDQLTCFLQAVKHPQWRFVMAEEIDALLHNQTWSLVLPELLICLLPNVSFGMSIAPSNLACTSSLIHLPPHFLPTLMSIEPVVLILVVLLLGTLCIWVLISLALPRSNLRFHALAPKLSIILYPMFV